VQASDPHLLAGLLRLVLDRLSDPLLTYSNFDKFVNTAQISEAAYRTSVMRSLVYSLPQQVYQHRELLIFVVEGFLSGV
jgi:RhoGAP domain